MTILSTSNWYVVQTQVHAERKAAAHLNRQGFETYLPCYLRRRRHARRVENIIAPLFSRYLFVAVDMAAQRWRCIQSTVGVVRLICNGEHPASVPHGVVDELKANEDERGLIALDTRPRFARGDKIIVLGGAFSSCLGLFEGMSSSERVSILLDLLGRKVRVVIGMHDIDAA
jgi:transcriptional antiterminator RfaH